MSSWKKQTSRSDSAALRALFPSMNLKPLDKIYDSNGHSIAHGVSKRRSNHLSFEKQLPRRPKNRKRQRTTPQDAAEMERTLKERESSSYDSMIRAREKLLSKRVAAVGFATVPARSRHFLSKFDGPVGMKETNHIDYAPLKDANNNKETGDAQDLRGSLDFSKQSRRKDAPLPESASLTYDVRHLRDHVPSSVRMNKLSSRSRKYSWLPAAGRDGGDPGKYYPSVETHSRKGTKAGKAVPNFARDTHRGNNKHLHPRIHMEDLSYNPRAEFGTDYSSRMAPDIFLSSSRHQGDSRSVLKSVDWLLGCVDKDMRKERRKVRSG